MSEIKAIQARVTGRVQGVAFRAWTRTEASVRGLRGWVRNDPDGAVTAVIAGPAQTVDDMARALHHGPPAAAVSGVEITAADWPATAHFDIRR